MRDFLVNFLCLLSCSGAIREGDRVLVGPKEDGSFSETTVASLHRNRAPCRLVRAGQASTVALTHVERTDIRKVRKLVRILVRHSLGMQL